MVLCFTRSRYISTTSAKLSVSSPPFSITAGLPPKDPKVTVFVVLVAPVGLGEWREL